LQPEYAAKKQIQIYTAETHISAIDQITSTQKYRAEHTISYSEHA
jgi:hypothetical protein